MSQARAARALARAFLLETWRSKISVFWNLVFPLFTLVLFSLIFGGGEPEGVARVLPGTMAMNLLAASFFGVSLYMVSLREREVYRRFAATPLGALPVIVAHALTAFLNIAVSFVLQFAVAMAFFGVSVRGSLLEVALTVAVGAFAFVPLGLLVGSVAQDMRSGPAMSNVLFFPLTFLSGAAVPLHLMPAWLQRAATLLPATYLVDLLHRAIVQGHPFRGAAATTGILLVTGVVGFAFNALLFRWESAQPLDRRALLLVVGSLAVVYAVAFARGVELETSRAPAGATRETGARPAAGRRVLAGMTVIDGLGGRIERGQITLEGERIVEVGPAGAPPQGAEVTDLSGSYVIPGLIDSHVHLGASAGGSVSSAEFLPPRLVHDLQAYLALGVTSFLSLTDHSEDMLTLRREVASGAMRAPHVFLSGPGITAPGGHPASLFSSVVAHLAGYMTRQASTPEAAEAAVRELAGTGVDVVKLYLDGGAPGAPLPVLPEPALRAAIRTAHALGLKTTVHVDSDAHARLAVAAGTDGIEHVPPDLGDAAIAELAARRVTLTPTLVTAEALARLMTGALVADDPVATAWVDPLVRESLDSPRSWIARSRASRETVAYHVRRFEGSRRALRRAVAGGVTIIAGSDAGNAAVFHGPSLLRELELLVQEGGMTPSAALVAATGAASERLGRKDVGRIAPGAYADLVVLEGDPERSVGAVREVRAVYLRGALLERERLLTASPGSWSAPSGAQRPSRAPGGE